MIDTISRLIAPIKARVNQLMRVALVKRVDNSQFYQRLQVLLAKDDPHELIRYQDFGFHSVPEEDSRAIVLFPSGNRASGFVICTSKPAQKEKLLTLKAGEVAVYNSSNSTILLKHDSLEMTHGTSKIILGENGQVQIYSGGIELIRSLQSLINQVQAASRTGTTPSGGPVTFRSQFPSAKSLDAFTGAT